MFVNEACDWAFRYNKKSKLKKDFTSSEEDIAKDSANGLIVSRLLNLSKKEVWESLWNRALWQQLFENRLDDGMGFRR